MSLDVDPFCPGAVSAMDKLMMRGAHHRQLDIRLRQRDAMLYTIQVRDKRKDLRARRIGTSRGGLTRARADLREYRPRVATNRIGRREKLYAEVVNFGSRLGARETK